MKLDAMVVSFAKWHAMIVKMQVPCCGGLSILVKDASKACKIDLIIDEFTLSIDGKIV
ncbi:MAG TPA: hypothetical protein PK520_08420 [Exilispira sp.]|jgi:hypothetical protein|nr:hypothetical protein [Exilispira sp.]HPB47757.1 hypothetical protein [Exilispira sp.]HQQ20100.1 hypothetical protein [Exilispira sp.]